MNRYRVPQGRGAGFAGAEIPLTQHDLASLAGTTRPTVNRVLRVAETAGAGEVHQTATAGSFRYIGPLILRLR